MSRARVFVGLLALSVASLGCSTAEGEGEVTSDRLYIEDCWNGPFDLDPDFFGANPYRDTVTIRIQHGDNIEEVSDGLIVLVNDVPGIRKGMLNQGLEVGLPPGVSPPGVPETLNAEPPLVSLSLFLHATCHEQNGALYSTGGTITFESLFSGDPNEDDAEDRRTIANFSASFADPRHILPTGEIDPERVSTVEGWFDFYFQRGQPAQPFP